MLLVFIVVFPRMFEVTGLELLITEKQLSWRRYQLMKSQQKNFISSVRGATSSELESGPVFTQTSIIEAQAIGISLAWTILSVAYSLVLMLTKYFTLTDLHRDPHSWFMTTLNTSALISPLGRGQLLSLSTTIMSQICMQLLLR